MTVIERPSTARVRALPTITARHAWWVLAASMAAFAVVRATTKHRVLGDLSVYRAEGMAIRHGAPLYGHLAGVHNLGTYPPFSAIVFVVLTPVPPGVLQVLCLIVNFGLLTTVCHLGFRLAGVRSRDALPAYLIFVAVALWCEPVFTTFAYGQINLLLLALILWDFTLPASSRWRGVGTGLAAAIKVTPAILIVYLVLTRRFRAAAIATLTFASTLVLSSLIDGTDTWRYWTHDLFDLPRVGHVEDAVNQTLRGMIVRVDHSPHVSGLGLAFIGAALIVGLVIARMAFHTLGDAWGLPAAAVTGLLTSPISWTHHWVWALPIAIVLWFRARVWLMPTFLIFETWVVWIVPWLGGPGLSLDYWALVLSGSYVMFGLGFLALTASRFTTARSAHRVREPAVRSRLDPL